MTQRSLLGNRVKSYANIYDLTSLQVLKDFLMTAERWQENSMPGEVLSCELPAFPNSLIIVKNTKTKTEYDKQNLTRVEIPSFIEEDDHAQ